MTSANVVEYRILLSGNVVGHHRKHAYCKSHFEDLLKFIPASDYEIQAYGYDEEDEYWEDNEIENLETFLKRVKVLKRKN